MVWETCSNCIHSDFCSTFYRHKYHPSSTCMLTPSKWKQRIVKNLGCGIVDNEAPYDSDTACDFSDYKID